MKLLLVCLLLSAVVAASVVVAEDADVDGLAFQDLLRERVMKRGRFVLSPGGRFTNTGQLRYVWQPN